MKERNGKSSILKKWLLRPSLWTCIVTIVAYWDKTALHGSFVYDDAGSIKKNVIVNGQKPLHEVWQRDFWGTPMADMQSHKSFRPITTLTFRWNWILAERLGTNDTEYHTYGFHLVNLGLHGIVTAMVTEVAGFVFDGGSLLDTEAQLITGFLFGLHPVHVEAVTNLTSRGELLMSLFFLAAFLFYVTKWKQKWMQFLCTYFFPWLCMTLSLFSKEQGATALITIVIYDFIWNHCSIQQFFKALRAGDAEAFCFLRRALILGLQTVSIALWRYWLNGETSPDFIFDQNPAGFSEDRFTRVFSVNWVYCLYIRDALFPKWLCPDWSGISIDLIESWKDPRVLAVLALFCFVAGCVYTTCFGMPSSAGPIQYEIRRIILVAFWGFLFSPFLLSSNLIVVVGLMKADRVIYLPLLGFCLVEALVFKVLCGYDKKLHHRGYLAILIQLFLFCAKLHERNVVWSHQLNLWMSAYEVNPRSHHTIYNCGYELSLKQRYKEAEVVLRPIANPHVGGPSNTFVYAMVLYNLKRCDLASKYIAAALDVVNEKRTNASTRDTPKALDRVESNLLVAKGFCGSNLGETWEYMQAAVRKDPFNTYARDSAGQVVRQIETLRKNGLQI